MKIPRHKFICPHCATVLQQGGNHEYPVKCKCKRSAIHQLPPGMHFRAIEAEGEKPRLEIRRTRDGKGPGALKIIGDAVPLSSVLPR